MLRYFLCSFHLFCVCLPHLSLCFLVHNQSLYSWRQTKWLLWAQWVMTHVVPTQLCLTILVRTLMDIVLPPVFRKKKHKWLKSLSLWLLWSLDLVLVRVEKERLIGPFNLHSPLFEPFLLFSFATNQKPFRYLQGLKFLPCGIIQSCGFPGGKTALDRWKVDDKRQLGIKCHSLV